MSDTSFAPDLKPYKDIGQFRFWCNKVLPLVYDDSLSYYELLCKVVNYLNDVIANSGVEEENIAKLLIAYKELEDYLFEKLDPAYFEKIEEDIRKLNEKYNELKRVIESYDIPNWKQFVNDALNRLDDEDDKLWRAYNELKDYLDNIDFQELINNKLDEMYEEGKLTSIKPATTEVLGGVIIGDGLVAETDGTTSVNVGAGLEIAENGSTAVRVDDETITIDPDTGALKGLAGREIVSQIMTNMLNPTLQSTTLHGLVLTNNGDGTYTVNGTASEDTHFENSVYLKQGSYKLVGCPSGGSSDWTTYQMYVRNIEGAIDAGNGVVFNIETAGTYNIEMWFNEGYVANNLLFKPMVTTTLSATYDDFVPYTGDTGSLNGDVAEIRNEIAQISNPMTIDTDTLKVDVNESTRTVVITFAETPVSSSSYTQLPSVKYAPKHNIYGAGVGYNGKLFRVYVNTGKALLVYPTVIETGNTTIVGQLVYMY